jgi:hypothetical protein
MILLFEKRSKKGLFISLSQRKGTKETRPTKPPFQGRLNLLRAETALRKGFGMALQPLPFGFAILFN